MLRRALSLTRQSAQGDRDTVMILLSARAGLRACEIAGLDWSMVVDARGQVGAVIEIRDAIAKYGSGRRIPMHRELRAALAKLKRSLGRRRPGDQVASRRPSQREQHRQHWFAAFYQKGRG